MPGAHIAFEIDDYDPEADLGRSVIVHGVTHDIPDGEDDLFRARRRAHVYPLALGAETQRLAIEPSVISGRRFRRLVSEPFLGCHHTNIRRLLDPARLARG